MDTTLQLNQLAGPGRTSPAIGYPIITSGGSDGLTERGIFPPFLGPCIPADTKSQSIEVRHFAASLSRCGINMDREFHVISVQVQAAAIVAELLTAGPARLLSLGINKASQPEDRYRYMRQG